MNVVHFPSCTWAQRVRGVINSWYGSEAAQHRWAWGTPCAHEQAGALEALFKFCWVSCAYIKILHLANVNPEKPAFHICIYQGVLELSTDGWGKFKSQVGPSKQKKGSFASATESGARGAQQWHRQALGTSRAQGVPCWVWGTISSQQRYLNTNIQSYWAEGTEIEAIISLELSAGLSCIDTTSSNYLKNLLWFTQF